MFVVNGSSTVPSCQWASSQLCKSFSSV